MESAARPPAVKRLAKILFVAVLAVVLALGGLALYLRVNYPAERLKAMLISHLAERYGVRVAIESLAFDLFSGFRIAGVQLVEAQGQKPDIPAAFRSPLQIEEIAFSYRWRSLLARRLDIDEITISQPWLRYWQAPDSSSNLDAWRAAFTDSAVAPGDTAQTELPLSIHLETLHIRALALSAAIVTTIDTQRIEVKPLDLEINEIDVDRRQNYRARFEIGCDPARVSYAVLPVTSPTRMEFASAFYSNLTGAITGDAVTLQAETSLAENNLNWNGEDAIALPGLRASAKASYNFATSRLAMPDLQLALEEGGMIDAGLDLENQQDAMALDLRITRGILDLAALPDWLHVWKNVGEFSRWQTVQAGGVLDFSGSEWHSDENGTRYRLALRVEGVNYLDTANGLKLTEAQAQIFGQGSSTSGSDSIACSFTFAGCALPLDTLLQTGPAELKLNATLTENFLPQQGDFEFQWQNFSQGTLSGKGALRHAGMAKPSAAEYDDSLVTMTIHADSLELAPFTADSLLGKINGKFELHGMRLNNLELSGKIENDFLTYLLEDDQGTIPPYHWSFSGKFAVDSSRTLVSLSQGSLRSELVQAGFHARYDLNAGSFDFNLPDLNLDLSRIVEILPHSFFEDQEPPQTNGQALGKGWLRVRTIAPDGSDYYGEFELHSERTRYHDARYDSYIDSLQIDNRWVLTPGKMVGEYSALCPSPRIMPSYLRITLPRTTTTGRIEVDHAGFVVKDAKFGIPDWQISGDYQIDGKYHSEGTRIGVFLPLLMQLGKSSLPEGMQVETNVNLRITADSPVSLTDGVTVQGRLAANMKLDQYLPEDKKEHQPSYARLYLESEDFTIVADSLLALHDMNASIDFEQDFDFLDMSLLGGENTLLTANAGDALLLYDILGDLGGVPKQPRSHLAIGRLEVGHYRISDITADMTLGRGRCDIPRLRMNLLGGNLAGSMLVDFGDGDKNPVTYSMRLQASSLDVSQLRRLSAEVEKGSQLSADLVLSGTGAAAEKTDEILAQLAGALNISKIEGKVASNLLQALDPKGTDVGVQRMRLLLKTGWNVKTMKFEIKNGFVYASLSLIKTKPWSALFNLPSTLDFARFPLRYFTQSDDQ